MTSQQVYLIRHGETEWSLSGQHTGITDLPLTESGRKVAKRLQPVLAKETFVLVLTSPLERARMTCELAGLGEHAEIDRDLMEWNYGEYEGLTPKQIDVKTPGWMISAKAFPGGKPLGRLAFGSMGGSREPVRWQGMSAVLRTATFAGSLRLDGLDFLPPQDVTSFSTRRH